MADHAAPGEETKAESIFIRGEGGGHFEFDLPLHETIADRLAKGYLQRVNEDGSDWVEGGPEVTVTPESRPALNAVKALWVGWAVRVSADRGSPITPDDAEALTKDDLIAAYGTDATTPAADPETTPEVTPEPEAPAATEPEAPAEPEAIDPSTPTTPVQTVPPGE